MSKPFDAMMRELFELELAAWLEFLGIPVPDPSQVKVIDSNVSTFTAEADKVVRVGGPEPLIVHTEFLSVRDLAQPEQALWYKLWTATAILIGLRLGRRKLGPPGAEVEARIAALGDLDRLRELLDRVLDVASWDELLGPPGQSA